MVMEILGDTIFGKKGEGFGYFFYDDQITANWTNEFTLSDDSGITPLSIAASTGGVSSTFGPASVSYGTTALTTMESNNLVVTSASFDILLTNVSIRQKTEVKVYINNTQILSVELYDGSSAGNLDNINLSCHINKDPTTFKWIASLFGRGYYEGSVDGFDESISANPGKLKVIIKMTCLDAGRQTQAAAVVKHLTFY